MANMQNGQTPEQGGDHRVGSGLPITPGMMLKLPSSLGQSPNIFSNFSAAEIEGELRKNLDFTRKVQQVNLTYYLSNLYQDNFSCVTRIS